MSVAWPTGMLCHSTLTGRVVWRIPGPRVGRHSCQRSGRSFDAGNVTSSLQSAWFCWAGRRGSRRSRQILYENIQDVLVDASMACKSIDIFGDGSWTCLRKSSGCSLAVDSGRRLVLIGGPANRNLSLPSNDFGRAIRVGHFVRRPSLQASPPRPSPTFQRTSLPSFVGSKTPLQFESASDIRYSLLPFLGNEKNSNHNADSLLTMGHPIRHISKIQPRFLCQGDTPNLRRPGPTPPVMGPALTGRGIPEPQSSLLHAWHQKPCSGVVTFGGTSP